MIAALAAAALAAASVPSTPAAERSAKAAVAVVKRYYAAINRRDYRTAYALWHGRYTLAQVRAGYSDTQAVRVRLIPPFTSEGAAGSSFCEVPVRVDATLKNGRRQHFTGSFTLRRVNDVDGSTAAQRRWHIVSAHLKQI
jgi:hypothetical protein